MPTQCLVRRKCHVSVSHGLLCYVQDTELGTVGAMEMFKACFYHPGILTYEMCYSWNNNRFQISFYFSDLFPKQVLSIHIRDNERSVLKKLNVRANIYPQTSVMLQDILSSWDSLNCSHVFCHQKHVTGKMFVNLLYVWLVKLLFPYVVIVAKQTQKLEKMKQ